MHWLFFSPFKCSLFINLFPQNDPKYWEWTGVKQWKTGLVDIVSQLGVLRSHSNRMSHWCHNQVCFKGWPLLNCIWMDLSIWLSLYSRDYGERSGSAITDIDCLEMLIFKPNRFPIRMLYFPCLTLLFKIIKSCFISSYKDSVYFLSKPTVHRVSSRFILIVKTCA